jgi:hypothetical protein
MSMVVTAVQAQLLTIHISHEREDFTSMVTQLSWSLMTFIFHTTTPCLHGFVRLNQEQSIQPQMQTMESYRTVHTSVYVEQPLSSSRSVCQNIGNLMMESL